MLSLFPFQDIGADFLARHTTVNDRTALLGDEMGLGKTPQAIAAAGRAGARTIGVVCPASARPTWKAEFEKWAHLFSGEVLYVASYDQVRGYPTNYHMPVDVLVLDEAHRLKSVYGARKGTPWTGRTQAVYGRKGLVHWAGAIWPMSGTPAPNNVGELWTHLRVLRGLDMTYERFHERYCAYDMEGRIVGAQNLDELREYLDGWLLRRKKAEVLPDLPPIRFETLPVEPDAPKTDELLEAEAQSGLADDDLNFETEHLSTLRRLTGEAKVAPYLRRLKDELDDGLEKVVVMAHHRAVLERMSQRLGDDGYPQVLYCGGMNDVAKAQAVASFQDGPARVFLGQIDAAGENITLTAADTLDMFESSWTPGANQQAAMRIHRIGQTRGVRVRYVTLEDSLDVVIQAVARRKAMTLMNLYD